MFKRIKVVTLLVAVLVVLGLMQLIGGTFFMNALSNDKTNFSVAQISNQNVFEMTDAWISLNQARVTLNRGMLRLQSSMASSINGGQLNELVQKSNELLADADKHFRNYKALPNTPGLDQRLTDDLESQFTTYITTLNAMTRLLGQGDLEGMFKQNAEQKQVAMQDVYRQWREAQARLSAAGVAESEAGFNRMIWVIRNVVDHICAIAAGDLTQDIAHTGNNEMSLLARNLREMQQALINTVSAVRDSTDTIFTGAGEISAGSNDLSSRTEQQAASIEETAASMEQLTATVKQNADNARQATQLARNASETAQRGGDVVNGVVKTMDDIADSTQRIGSITSLINDIAFQTNILALNAAVEAARAGEQGKGFAVVAGEVRHLASRSASAANDIRKLIDASASKVQSGSEQVHAAGRTMDDIVVQVKNVTQLIAQISHATSEQATGLSELTRAVAELDSITQKNADLVEESARISAMVKHRAGRLKDAVTVLH